MGMQGEVGMMAPKRAADEVIATQRRCYEVLPQVSLNFFNTL